jgi:hypothetical protein
MKFFVKIIESNWNFDFDFDGWNLFIGATQVKSPPILESANGTPGEIPPWSRETLKTWALRRSL